MNDTDRILGELGEFKRYTIEELRELRVEVKGLSTLRWKISGALAVIIGIAELVNVLVKK
jgi:hypothetical protein